MRDFHSKNLRLNSITSFTATTITLMPTYELVMGRKVFEVRSQNLFLMDLAWNGRGLGVAANFKGCHGTPGTPQMGAPDFVHRSIQ